MQTQMNSPAQEKILVFEPSLRAGGAGAAVARTRAFQADLRLQVEQDRPVRLAN